MSDTSFLEDFGKILKTKCMHEEPPFCQVACPFRLDIRDLADKWEGGRFNAAYRSYQTAVAFPGIVSQLCPGPCGKGCVLKDHGGHLAIRDLERASIRLAGRKEPNAYNLPQKPQKIAVIGGGLSGLGCALRLCNKKYAVTVFEAADRVGGSARDQMDPDAFDREIAFQFQHEEPEFRCGTEVAGLSECEGYDAVYIATGTGGRDFGLRLTGEGAFASARPGFFLGGGVTGITGMQALADGIRASSAIERYLKTGLMNEPVPAEGSGLLPDPARLEERPAVPMEDPGTGFSKEEAMAEAHRCFRCSCDICMQECDLLRIQQKTPARLYEEAYITVRPSTLANDGRWATRRIASCDQCGLCREVCPQHIDFGTFLLQSHRGLKETDAMPWAFHDYWLRDMAFSASEAALVRRPAGTKKSRFALFPGCQTGASDPDCVSSVYRWMRSRAEDTALWINCCGAPAVWAVEDDLHEKHKDALISQWKELGEPVVVMACPTCRKMFDQYLPELPTVFLEEWLLEWGIPEREDRGRDTVLAVFDPCASRDYPGLQAAVRELMRQMGAAFEELPHAGKNARCCSWGGQYGIAAPDYARRVRRERAEESELPYLTYCMNCRDAFASRHKESVYLPDLIFGGGNRRREAPTVTARWENRRKLKAQLLAEFWQEEEERREPVIRLTVSPELEQKLSDTQILVSDMEEVVAFLEEEQRGVLHPDTGHITGHKKIGHMTYWAEYEPCPDGSFVLHSGYAHRMNLEGE